MNKTVIVVMKKNCRAVGENTAEEYNQLKSSEKSSLGKLYLRSKEWGVSSARKEKRYLRQWEPWVVTAFHFQELTECKCSYWVGNRGCSVTDEAGQKGNDYKFRYKGTILRIWILTLRVVKSH